MSARDMRTIIALHFLSNAGADEWYNRNETCCYIRAKHDEARAFDACLLLLGADLRHRRSCFHSGLGTLAKAQNMHKGVGVRPLGGLGRTQSAGQRTNERRALRLQEGGRQARTLASARLLNACAKREVTAVPAAGLTWALWKP